MPPELRPNRERRSTRARMYATARLGMNDEPHAEASSNSGAPRRNSRARASGKQLPQTSFPQRGRSLTLTTGPAAAPKRQPHQVRQQLARFSTEPSAIQRTTPETSFRTNACSEEGAGSATATARATAAGAASAARDSRSSAMAAAILASSSADHRSS
eukprot:9692915-Alexandrium_andersonii.AAC.1